MALRMPVEGRKGAAYTLALAALLLLGFGAGVHTSPLRWEWADGTLDALLYALAGLLATMTAGNYGEHSAGSKKPEEPKT